MHSMKYFFGAAVACPFIFLFFLLDPLYTGNKVEWEKGTTHFHHLIIRKARFVLTNSVFERTRWHFWIDGSVSPVLRASLSPFIGIPHLLLVWVGLILSCWLLLLIRIAVFTIVMCFMMAIVLLFWGLAMTNAELNYFMFGEESKDFHWKSTVSGLLSEDLIQIIIQGSYAIVLSDSFGKRVGWVQALSFAFSIWRLWFGLAYKWMKKEDDKPRKVFDYTKI